MKTIEKTFAEVVGIVIASLAVAALSGVICEAGPDDCLVFLFTDENSNPVPLGTFYFFTDISVRELDSGLLDIIQRCGTNDQMVTFQNALTIGLTT